MDEGRINALVRLQAISAILGVSVDCFINQSVPNDLLANDECFWLWTRLKTEKGRQQALDALRRVVDDETT